jgi:hypothetical protein
MAALAQPSRDEVQHVGWCTVYSTFNISKGEHCRA